MLLDRKEESMQEFDRLVHIVDRLRDPESGCPWDLKQTPESLIPNFIEELYECVEAIEAGDHDDLREELGDLLLHIVMQVRIARENDRFNFEEVLQGIGDKLVRRHPHIFGDINLTDAGEVKMHWERLKQKEKTTRESVIDGIPRSMPALIVAQRTQEKAASVGFDWPGPEPVLDKLHEEVAEFEAAFRDNDKEAVAEELGDLFFTLVNMSRKLGLDSEAVMKKATDKFSTRFRAVERVCRENRDDIHECTLEKLDAIWETVKKG
jgi:MazG family protein